MANENRKEESLEKQLWKAADKLGSGVRNIFKYTPAYSGGAEPELMGGNIFRIMIPLSPSGRGPGATDKTTDMVLSERQKEIIALIKEDAHISQEEMAKRLGLSIDGVRYHTDRLKEMGILKRVGGKKMGRWEVVE